MSAGGGAAGHAGTLYRRLLRFLRHPLRTAEAEAEHLREVEEAGESPATPFIAILGIILFLLPIVVVVGGVVFAAYFLAR